MDYINRLNLTQVNKLIEEMHSGGPTEDVARLNREVKKCLLNRKYELETVGTIIFQTTSERSTLTWVAKKIIPSINLPRLKNSPMGVDMYKSPDVAIAIQNEVYDIVERVFGNLETEQRSSIHIKWILRSKRLELPEDFEVPPTWQQAFKHIGM